MQFPATELVLDAKGAVYHLGLLPEQLATKVILVGDQDRVAKISCNFDHIEFKIQHREFISHTGTFKGKRITVLSTGIEMTSPDIRAGVSLLIAALSAKGKSVIHNIEQIDRGYQDIEYRLNNIGADIRRIG